VTSRDSSRDMVGRMPGSRRASMVLPEPGGPMSKNHRFVTRAGHIGADAWVVERDARMVAGPFKTNVQAIAALHRLSPQSADWAIRYEGYAIRRIENGDGSVGATHREARS
jgi:hypothetical protein